MKNEISKIQLIEVLIEVLSDGIYHKQLLNQYGLNIRLDRNYKFYYNFDSFYNQDDLDFVYCITRDFEKLDAKDGDGNYIQNEIDDMYLFNCADELRDTIIYELTNYSSFKDIKITS